MNTPIDPDGELAERYGSYASYSTDADPILVETYGDGPADEVDRLLDVFATPESRVLDLGCGAGFTLCRLAQRVAAIWGFDQDADLLNAVRQRVATLGLTNVTLVPGDAAVPGDVAPLPDGTFDVILSRRGPNDAERDRAALELYVRYNATPKGVRVMNHRQVYLFRRTAVHYVPVAPELKPLE